MSQEAGQGDKKGHSVLLRKGSSNKMALKEKIVQIYEAFFQGEDPSAGNPNFWDELFLLKVNTTFIETECEKLSGEGLLSLKENFNLMFYKAVETLKQDNSIRTANAVHTLCALVRGIYKKTLKDYGFDVINILIGFDSAETVIQSLIESVNRFLNGDYPVALKQLILKFLLVLASVTDNISQNTLLEYILINSVYESLIQILANPVSRQTLGVDAILVLTLLVQYRKYESANPYIVKLSILDDELALTGYAEVVSVALSDFNRDYKIRSSEQQTGWFSTLANMVGNMFVAEEKEVAAVRANDSVLLALYEAIHLNRNFITALTHAHTPSIPSTPPSSPTPDNSPVEDKQVNPLENSQAPIEPAHQPTNLLVTFLEYSSVVIQDTKEQTRYNNARLCLIILTCIAEDQYANSLMHDINMNFRVPLHRMPMRHRKAKFEASPPSRPLVCALLDLMVEFIMSHLMKTMPLELYTRCLGICHRVLCYQKKCRVRLQYPWKNLWTALINLLKFILSHENHLVKRANIFHICSKIVNIFNLFITYGDTFLPNPSSYDELYYEIIRMHQVFDNLYSMALRYTTSEGDHKESAARLTNHLINVRAIVNHFTPKVDSWAANNHLSSLTEEQVLEVVRASYDTLTLKLQDSLDQFERYTEKPNESAFFTQLVRSIITDVRKSVSEINIDQQTILQEVSPMPPTP
ncbi:armadillo-like helical domain-containing protein 3 [Mercenaria mercenaria]|uniref:armadillo-like helical domain-containing protein 3 n=1 Tax=Mercenaria mercenaria TaxID=6596 RepID=UPI00234F1126|nr:armadillo-like helical domain-containing protein 3 [Mercenaria mercenaria]